MTSAYGNVRGDFYADNQGSADAGGNYPLPYDTTMGSYTGVQFDILKGSGTTTFPITFEMVGESSVPPSSGGTANTANVDQYNHRGWLISSLGSGWQTVTVPFSLLIPHWFPSAGSSGCGSSGMCEAPTFDAKHALGLQFSVNPDQSANGSFDIWIDNVQLVTDASAGLLPSGMTMPTWHDTAPAHCALPTGATGKSLMWAYSNWKNQFVKGNAGSSRYVVSPEINGGSVVSEGIGYGLLIAVYFGDHQLFDDLWSFWSSHSSGGLMTWRWNNTGSSSTGSGSATDADEDAAFALIEAGKKWGGSYASTAATLIGEIWGSDIDSASSTPKGGSNYSSPNPTNPSYFAPAYYRVFAGVDSGHDWNSVATKVYSLISSLQSGTSASDGLLPAWCGSGCSSASMNNASTDVDYQYDSHRIPWRIGIDYCWNGTSSATSFLDKNSGFFSGIAGTNQIGRVMDMYTPSGGSVSGSAPNSLSIIGTSGVGAMHSSSYAAYTQQAWQLVLDGLNRGQLDVSTSGGNSGYSYYNATIGLMTALMMSGNFYQM
jgi:endo-1,4-beta-D-glucanase Y